MAGLIPVSGPGTRSDRFFVVSLEGSSAFVLDMNLGGARLNRQMAPGVFDAVKVVAAGARNRARSGSPQLRAVASSIRASGGRAPAITAGGSRSAGTRSGASAGDIFFGANFGSIRYKQFPRPIRGGSTIYPELRDGGMEKIEDAVAEVVGDVWMGKG